jgi:tocopherol O-methyltransferase
MKSGEKVIDAGCGIGGSSIWLANSKNCEVTGINIVDTQLQQASKNAIKAGVGHKVKFLKADYTHLPIKDKTHDVFWALESVVHAPNKADVVKEAFRVLDEGGRIVMAEYLLREKPPLSKEENAYLQPWLEGWSMPSLETISGYKEYLKSAGFANIQFFNINENVRPSLRRLRLLCNLALPGARVMELFGLFTRERVANIEGSLRQISAFDKGCWDYFIITATKTRE